MDLAAIRNDLMNTLKPSRYLHSVGVEEVAHDMALIFGYDIDKAVLAGLLHDCAKQLSDRELIEACQQYKLNISEVERRCPHLLHGKVGAAFAKWNYGVEDEEVLNAITYHTTGRPSMTTLEKIIFLADYIEPNRRPIPGINEIRKICYSDLDLAVYLTTDHMLEYLRNKCDEIDPLTQETHEYYRHICKVQE